MSATDSTPATRPRWRFTFRLSTLFVVITIAAFACAGPRFYRQYQFWQLQTYLDRDLRELPANDLVKVHGLVEQLWPETRGDFGEVSWFLWRLRTDRGTRVVLFQGEILFNVPGNSRAKLFLFNDWGDLIHREQFTTGNRVYIRNARINTTQLPGEPVLEIDVLSWFGGIHRQCYGLFLDRPALIRLEDSAGALTADEYPCLEKPLPPPPAEEWIAQLSDPRPAKVLQALTWIAVRTEASEELQQSVCRDIRTKAVVDRLARHDNPWVAEMATYAQTKLSK